jgi:hypothetical protein
LWSANSTGQAPLRSSLLGGKEPVLFFFVPLRSRCAVQSVGACDRQSGACASVALLACVWRFLSLSVRAVRCSAVSVAPAADPFAFLPFVPLAMRYGRRGGGGGRLGANRRTFRRACFSCSAGPRVPLERHSTGAAAVHARQRHRNDGLPLSHGSPDGSTDRCTKEDDAAWRGGRPPYVAGARPCPAFKQRRGMWAVSRCAHCDSCFIRNTSYRHSFFHPPSTATPNFPCLESCALGLCASPSPTVCLRTD